MMHSRVALSRMGGKGGGGGWPLRVGIRGSGHEARTRKGGSSQDFDTADARDSSMADRTARCCFCARWRDGTNRAMRGKAACEDADARTPGAARADPAAPHGPAAGVGPSCVWCCVGRGAVNRGRSVGGLDGHLLGGKESRNITLIYVPLRKFR